MAQILECTFNNINGERTGVWTRTRKTKNSPSPGILYKRNCPDNLHYYCDPNDSGNSYYRLLNPERYDGIDTSMGTVYVYVGREHLTGWRIINDGTSTPSTTPTQSTPNTSYPNYGSSGSSANDNSIILATNTNTNITNASPKVLSDSITEYISYITKPEDALTPKGKYQEYSGQTNVSDNYFMDYSSFISDINKVEKNLNIAFSAEASAAIKNDMMNKFNRYLIAYPTEALSKTFAHVFFTRPDLNLYDNNGNLLPWVANDPYFYYLNRNNPQLLKSLTTRNFSLKHEFNPFLSNKAGSFDIKDEYIDTGEHGETYTGWKIKFGKHNIKSKTADSFSINYTDDNNYNIFKIHKAWTDYISKVYRGEFFASDTSIKTRTIDYAASVYYFLCGPDGETILFWSKYTGVFPTNTPSSASSWQKGNIVKMPEFAINYEFAWKEDMMPTTLAEFNLNSAAQSQYEYAKTYDPELGSTGASFVNAPFIETVINSHTNTYEYKLRFRT